MAASCGASSGDRDSVEDSDNGAEFEILVDDFIGLAEDPNLRERRFLQIQDAIEVCMLERGFEFQRQPDTAADLYGEIRVPGYELLTLTPEDAVRTGFRLVPPPAVLDGKPEYEIPESLAEEERFSYDVNLHGLGGSPEDDLPSVEGCIAIAERNVGHVNPGRAFEQFREVQHEQFERFASHPDVVELSAEWSRCMADAGHEGIEDPVHMDHTFAYFWSSLAPSVVPGATSPFSVEQQDLDVLNDADQRLAQTWVSCIESHRPDLQPIWSEYFGYRP